MKDASGCIYSTSIVINNAAAVTDIASTVVNANCGNPTGSINLGAVTGGTSPFTYSFNSVGGPYTSTTNYSGLTPGAYTIEVKDANGCIYTTTISITDNPGPTAINTVTVDENCSNSNGSVTLGAVTGGTGPFTYNFNNAGYSGSTTYTGLVAGNYPLEVQDANGCTYLTSIIILNNPGPTAIVTTVVDEACNAADGSVNLGTVTGGTGPYTYAFDTPTPFTTTTSYTGLVAGIYNIIVKDANGCTYSTSVTISNSGGPTAVSTTDVNENCGAGDGSIIIGAVTGGVSPYTYEFNGTGVYTSTTSYTGLAAATYTIKVKDANGCIYTFTVTLTNSGGPTAVATTQVNSTCGTSNGSITIGAVTGGSAPFTYSFNGSAYTPTTVYSGLAAGAYTINVKDANGCIYTTTVTITGTTAPTAIVTTLVNESCSGTNGSVTLGTVSGGTAPYTYNFNGGGFTTTTSFPNLSAGNYTIIVQDANGCTYNTSVNITNTSAPTAIAVTTVDAACGVSNGSVTFGTVTGGAPAYDYNFNNFGFSTTTTYSGLAAGSYTLIVRDSNGCTYSTLVAISNSGGPTAIGTTIVNETCRLQVMDHLLLEQLLAVRVLILITLAGVIQQLLFIII